MNTEKMKNAVEAALGGRLADLTVETGASPVEGSPVEGSPNGAVLIYLTDAGAEGPHVLVTDADDVGEGPGHLVGAYFEEGEQMDEPRSCPTYTAAALVAASLVGELAGAGA